MSDNSPDLPLNFLKSADAVIRNQALGAATSLIDYHSEGQCLVIGPATIALGLAESLQPLQITVLEICDSAGARPSRQLTEDGIAVYTGKHPRLSGYLGAFSVVFDDGDRTHDLAALQFLASGFFDVILDLSETALIATRLPPFGYRSVPLAAAMVTAIETSDQAQLPDALQSQLVASANALSELTGDFDKPRYFDYDAKICAHQRSRLSGCSNCLDVCATGAIRASGDGVEVDPYLCQGCGTCATVCPGGAMTYAYPRVNDAIERTRKMLREHGSECSVLLLYPQSDEEQDVAFENTLPDYVLPVAVEEVTAFGIDYWASMFAAGVNHIVIHAARSGAEPTTDSVLSVDEEALTQQALLLQTILSGMDLAACRITLSKSAEALQPMLQALRSPARTSAADFASHNNKRQTFRTAIDALGRLHPPTSERITLAAGSPFGVLRVDRDACTLCMACVSTCPAGALLDGNDMPRLRFIEANCLQCGLCEQACPEDAIVLEPTYRYDSVAAREIDTLNEEEPFNCIRCHKPFATRKMIDNMSGKLSGHWMFNDERAIQRLKMCEDCRVVDIFEADAAGIQVHKDD